MLIDTHCHLAAEEFSADRDAVFAAARAAGVCALVVPAVAVNNAASNFAAVRDCCARYTGCFAAYGIHPLFVDRASTADLATLRAWLIEQAAGAHPAVAVGEIGLDFFVAGFDAARQEYFFIEQLKIARDLDLPVLLHVRRSVDPVLKCLRRIKVRGGIAHAFNGSRQQADALLKLGFKLGFGGALTFTGSRRIRELAATLPLEAIVLETDAPDMPPEFIGRARNSPENLPRIAAVLAELRGQSPASIAQATRANARAVLPALPMTACAAQMP